MFGAKLYLPRCFQIHSKAFQCHQPMMCLDLPSPAQLNQLRARSLSGIGQCGHVRTWDAFNWVTEIRSLGL